MAEHLKKVVVAGGSGFLGSNLVSSLRNDGVQVVVLTRRPRADGDVGWDGRGQGSWARELDGADAVVNLAGESIGGHRWTHARRERILRSRVDSTIALVTALAAVSRGPRVLVNISGIGYAGDCADEVVTEDAAPGTSFLSSVCVAWEAEASAAADVGVRTVVLRTPLVIAREAKAVKLMALPFRLFVGGRAGNGRQWFPWIHVRDWVAVCRLAIKDDALQSVVNVVAPQELRQWEAAHALARGLHRPAVVPAPAAALRALMGEQADLLLHGQRARSTRLDSFPFAFPTIASALAEALR